MDYQPARESSPDAVRTTRLIAHLEGALDGQTLDAMTGVWSVLEQAAADDSSHARAVRARLFWQTLTPYGAEAPVEVGVDQDASPGGAVVDLQPVVDVDLDDEWAAQAA